MGWFTKSQKEEDKRLLKEFETCLKEIDSLADDFRLLHARSIEAFEENLTKKKSTDDLDKERILFEQQFDVLQKLKFQTDLLIDEGFRIVRNESVLTEKDRIEMKKAQQPKKAKPKQKKKPSKPKKKPKPKKKAKKAAKKTRKKRKR